MTYKWTVAKGIECSPRHPNCQDNISIKKLGPILCSCVSDGAGSALLSEFGSEALTENICDYVCNSFYELMNTAELDISLFKARVLDKSNDVLKTVQESKQCSLQDLSATLLFFASDGKRALWFHVGDGVIIAKRNTEFYVISAPFNGEYSNETVFVTSSHALELADAGILHLEPHGQYSFLLMTDGPEIVFYSRKKNSVISEQIIIYLESFISNKQNKGQGDRLLQYLLHERCRKYSADDLSIAFLLRKEFKQKRRKQSYTKRAVGRNHHGRKQKR